MYNRVDIRALIYMWNTIFILSVPWYDYKVHIGNILKVQKLLFSEFNIFKHKLKWKHTLNTLFSNEKYTNVVFG